MGHLLKGQGGERSFQLVRDEVDFLVVPFVARRLSAPVQVGPGLEGHVPNQDLAVLLQQGQQIFQKSNLLRVCQVMEGVGGDDEIVPTLSQGLHQTRVKSP